MKLQKKQGTKFNFSPTTCNKYTQLQQFLKKKTIRQYQIVTATHTHQQFHNVIIKFQVKKLSENKLEVWGKGFCGRGDRSVGVGGLASCRRERDPYLRCSKSGGGKQECVCDVEEDTFEKPRTIRLPTYRREDESDLLNSKSGHNNQTTTIVRYNSSPDPGRLRLFVESHFRLCLEPGKEIHL